MRELSRVTAISLGILLSLSAAADESLNVSVVGVSDGDTIVVLDELRQTHRIRLDGIDAPEKGQAYSRVATRNLTDMVHGSTVTATCPKRDKYGRLVCLVSINGADVGLEQVRAGLAWHFKRYELEQQEEKRREYSEAERDARANRRGLWKDDVPMAPWDWRAVRRGNGKALEPSVGRPSAGPK